MPELFKYVFEHGNNLTVVSLLFITDALLVCALVYLWRYMLSKDAIIEKKNEIILKQVETIKASEDVVKSLTSALIIAKTEIISVIREKTADLKADIIEHKGDS